MVFTVWLELDIALLVELGLSQLQTKTLVIIASQVKSVELRRKSVMTVKLASSVILKDKRPVLSAPNIKEQILLQEVLLKNAKMDF